MSQKTDMSSATQPTKSPLFSFLVNFWIFIPIVIYFVLLDKYALNLPLEDDYDAILIFMNDYKAADFMGKLQAMFSAHNEHKLLHSRIIYVLYDAIFGSINFNHLRLIANFQLVLLFLIIVSYLRKLFPKYWNVVALIVSLCIFAPSNYDNSYMVMAGMQNFGIILLFAASIYFYDSDKKWASVVAPVVQVLCIFSSGSGPIAGMMVFLYTLLVGADKKKKITSLIVAVVCGALYYMIHITGSGEDRAISGTLSNVNIGDSIWWFFNIFGAHFAFATPEAMEYSYIWGGLMVIVIAFVAVKRKKELLDRNLLSLIFILAFVTITIGLISLVRAQLGGPYYQSRFLINSHVAMGLVFVLLAYQLQNTGSKFIVLLAGFGLINLYTFSQDYKYGEGCLGMENNRLQYVPYYYRHPRAMTKEQVEKAISITKRSCELNIYCIEEER